jgi:two-component system, sensor histidine kinase PdtaS
MKPDAVGPRHWARSLKTRLIAFLTIALLPLGVIAVLQTVQVTREATRLAERDVLARTDRAAAEQDAALRRAIGAADALGIAASELRDDVPACSRIMSEFVTAQPEFIFAGFIAADGLMECNSADMVMDYSGDDDWERFLADPAPSVKVDRDGDASGQSVFISLSPIFDQQTGSLLGAQAVSIPHALSRMLMESADETVELALVDANGDILATSMGMENPGAFERLGVVPAEMDIPRQGVLTSSPRGDGAASRPTAPAAVVPLIPGRIYVIGLWTAAGETRVVSLFGRAIPAFPILMWLASLLVAYFTVNNLVLRHLSRLSARMEAYRSGESLPDFQLGPEAPAELREMADSYNELVKRVAQDQASLEDSLREQKLLLREVHHRVKNNLQLIASILNMQMRGVEDPAAKRALGRVQDRVMSLSSIHRALYTDSRLDRVRVDHLLAEIVAGLEDVALPREAKVAVRTDLAPVWLDPDKAVPLLLLATEAVTNAAKYMWGHPKAATPKSPSP